MLYEEMPPQALQRLLPVFRSSLQMAGNGMQKESVTHQVPSSIDTETNRGLRATVYKFDKNGKVIKVIKGK